VEKSNFSPLFALISEDCFTFFHFLRDNEKAYEPGRPRNVHGVRLTYRRTGETADFTPKRVSSRGTRTIMIIYARSFITYAPAKRARDDERNTVVNTIGAASGRDGRRSRNYPSAVRVAARNEGAIVLQTERTVLN